MNLYCETCDSFRSRLSVYNLQFPTCIECDGDLKEVETFTRSNFGTGPSITGQPVFMEAIPVIRMTVPQAGDYSHPVKS